MIKEAYELGIQLALEDAGLIKQAGRGKLIGAEGALAGLGEGVQNFVKDPRTWGVATLGAAGLGAGALGSKLTDELNENKRNVGSISMGTLLGLAGAGTGAAIGGEGNRGRGAAIGGAAGAGLGALLPQLLMD